MLQNNFFTIEYDIYLGYFTNILYIVMRYAGLLAKYQKYTIPVVENKSILSQVFRRKKFTSIFLLFVQWYTDSGYLQGLGDYD